jgi:hypothetical protein
VNRRAFLLSGVAALAAPAALSDTFGQAELKAYIRRAFAQARSRRIVYVGAPQVVASFAGIASLAPQRSSTLSIIGAADTYVSDFGRQRRA